MRRLTLALILIFTLLLGQVPMPAQASSYSQIILAADPERYFRFDATSGSFTDLAHGGIATCASCTYSQAGAIYDGNTAVKINASSQIVTPIYGPKNRSYSVEFWFKIDSGATNNQTVYPFRLILGGGEDIRLQVTYTTASGYSMVFYHNIGTTQTLNTLLPDTWYYTILQFNNVVSRMEYYINGVLYSSWFETSWASGYVGPNAGQGALLITLDEYALYNRTLTQDEITLHYNTGFVPFYTPTPTITYTPTITFTPTNTPTPTVTPTLTPGWDYEIPLPSGRTAAVRMEATAGDVTIIMLLVFAVAIMLLTVYLRRRSNGS